MNPQDEADHVLRLVQRMAASSDGPERRRLAREARKVIEAADEAAAERGGRGRRAATPPAEKRGPRDA